MLANLLLTKYEAQLSDEQKAQIQAIQQPDAALSAFADVLTQQGSVTEAVDVQKEAIKANSTKIENYRKLAKLYKQMGKTGVNLFVNGSELKAEVAPILRDGTTLVPFRAIAEALKASVSWNANERSVTVTRGNTVIKLFIDSNTATVNGNTVTLEVAPTIFNGNTIVPARFISEALKAIVSWDQQSGSAIINDPTQTGTAPSTTDGTSQSGTDQSTTGATTQTGTDQTTTGATTQTGTGTTQTDTTQSAGTGTTQTDNTQSTGTGTTTQTDTTTQGSTTDTTQTPTDTTTQSGTTGTTGTTDTTQTATNP